MNSVAQSSGPALPRRWAAHVTRGTRPFGSQWGLLVSDQRQRWGCGFCREGGKAARICRIGRSFSPPPRVELMKGHPLEAVHLSTSFLLGPAVDVEMKHPDHLYISASEWPLMVVSGWQGSVSQWGGGMGCARQAGWPSEGLGKGMIAHFCGTSSDIQAHPPTPQSTWDHLSPPCSPNPVHLFGGWAHTDPLCGSTQPAEAPGKW